MKKKRILIMGLPGSGKTTLASKLVKILNAKWINADQVRKKVSDWDFSKIGVERQALRMFKLSNKFIKKGNHVVADFICPTPKTRKIFNPNFIVWVDTIKKGRFEKMNKMFIKPKKYNVRVDSKQSDIWAFKIADKIVKYKWDNKKSTAQMLGRWQPWHEGHQELFYEIIKKEGQVYIMVKDVHGIGDNPFSYKIIKKRINKKLKDFKNRFKIVLAPNITNICYGRTVGYNFEKINLPKSIQQISGTKIRKQLRMKGKI